MLLSKKILTIFNKIPEFCMSHWLLRIPLIIVFIQQGISKYPVNLDDAQSFELPFLVWWFVVYGELGSGLGLLVGGFLLLDNRLTLIGDMLTRFSGFTIGSIMTGVIWIGKPESFVDVLLYDNFHVILWFGGLYFALRGNRI
jgi:putative oxidoreductase